MNNTSPLILCFFVSGQYLHAIIGLTGCSYSSQPKNTHGISQTMSLSPDPSSLMHMRLEVGCMQQLPVLERSLPSAMHMLSPWSSEDEARLSA
jgi:hypothetical protein